MKKVTFVAWFLLLSLAFLLLAFRGCSISSDRSAPKLLRTATTFGQKGDIISADGYTLVSSKRLYNAQIDLRSLDFSKLDYFLKLYEIYSYSSPEQTAELKARILKARKDGVGNFVLNPALPERAAASLSSLARKLYTQGFFRPFKTPSGSVLTSGLDVVENKEMREFLKGDILTPVLGYSTYGACENGSSGSGKNDNNCLRPQKGLERYYQDCLRASSDYSIKGVRDIGQHIIINQQSFLSEREDGCRLHLAVNLKLQKGLENIATAALKTYGAQQIIIGIMRARDAKIIALATSKRYDPYNRPADLSYLNTDAVEFEYEPGSVIKPIVFAHLLKLRRLQPLEWINTHNGRLQLAQFSITDTHPAAKMIAEDVIVHSSNIGMVELSGRESIAELVAGLQSFGIARHTGIDLPYEAGGYIRELDKIYEIEKKTMAYGYGFRTTFMQLLSAYNVFSTGKLITPRIALSYELAGLRAAVPQGESASVLTAPVAYEMRRILIKTANQKSLARFWPTGLQVGGKTGTARVTSKRGGYLRDYNSNFFGFASDGENAYTIGVLVMSPDKNKKGYYAAQTAVPIAASAINQLVDDGHLHLRTPDFLKSKE